MKFMKLGSLPDTSYTEDNIRTLDTFVPTDLTVYINNTTYHLHKYALLPKCGILKDAFLEGGESSSHCIELHDVPGGEEAFELCFRFCYGIQIHISAENFVLAYCAAKFLQMTEVQEKGNFVKKLESFFKLFVLEGWKDSILALQSTLKLPDYADEVGITRRCIDSIVDKILVPPPKVTWSFTYSRHGYERRQHVVPIDWWTEDLSNLDLELFRSVIDSIKSTNMLSPQLIGEALHMYASFNLLPKAANSTTPESSNSHSDRSIKRKKQMLEAITILIPHDRGSVTIKFLFKLMILAHHLDLSSSMKAELIRRCSAQLGDATVDDLLLVSSSATDQFLYDIELVQAMLENYLTTWRRVYASQPEDKPSIIRSIQKVGKLIDSFLQVAAGDANMPVSDFISLAKALPRIARSNHDELYKAINIYLKEHPNLPKEDKRSLCSILDCENLSHDVTAHAVKNELLPLRTVVQVLFFEQEKAANSKLPNELSKLDLRSPSYQRESASETKSTNISASDQCSDLPGLVGEIRSRKDVGNDSQISTPRRKFRLSDAVKKILHR
ncbi:unnamed protein product [Rhodiola kirilowii]